MSALLSSSRIVPPWRAGRAPARGGLHSYVRTLGAGGLTPPSTLREVKGGDLIMEPYQFSGDEWQRAHHVLWHGHHVPYDRRNSERRRHLVALTSQQVMRLAIGDPIIATIGQTTVALDSIYTYASAGDAIAARINLPGELTLDKVYYYLTGSTGTLANVTSTLTEIRNDSTNKPGATLHASSTQNPSGLTLPTWTANGTNYGLAVAADTLTWVVVANTDASAPTDFVTVLRNVANMVQYGALIAAFSTLDGFATAATVGSEVSCIVLVFSNGSSIGNPYTVRAASTNGTNQRGFYIDGFVEALKIRGLVTPTSVVNSTGINLWEGAGAGPSGSPTANGTSRIVNIAGTPVIIGRAFTSAQTLAKATVYRPVLAFGSASTSPAKFQIGVGADANLKAAMLGGGGLYWAEANGTTNWANDNTAEFPSAGILLEDQVAVAGGGLARIIGG